MAGQDMTTEPTRNRQSDRVTVQRTLMFIGAVCFLLAKAWTDPIRFLHIDAGHDKDEVAETIKAFLQFMGKGALMAGDDWNWPGVQQGVGWCFMPQRVTTYLNKLWWVNF